MNVTVNNKPVETGASTLKELALQLELPEKGVAVAVSNKQRMGKFRYNRRSQHHRHQGFLRRLTGYVPVHFTLYALYRICRWDTHGSGRRMQMGPAAHEGRP